MNMLRFDSVGGASGNMILGALIDLGVPVEGLKEVLGTLPFGDFSLVVEPASSHGLHGQRVRVLADDPPAGPPGEQAHAHGRHLSDVEQIIDRGHLPAAVRDQAAAVFRRLAEAEAAVHGTTPERVHFHEVGAIDSIIDVVGCCWALHALDVEAIWIGALPVGQGTHRCAHGVMPLPVPATVELLRERIPMQPTDESCELVTPTGAALLSTWPRADRAEGVVRRSGCGFGTRTLAGRPNLIRATLLEPAIQVPPGTDRCTVLECNLDDTTPEIVGALCEQLMQRGALDVFSTSALMKKQRPGILLTVLCRPEDRDAFVETLFRESTTFGIRCRETERLILDRSESTVTTRYGTIRLKTGTWRGECITVSPELDDCRRAATEHGVPVRKVYVAAQAATGEGDGAV